MIRRYCMLLCVIALGAPACGVTPDSEVETTGAAEAVSVQILAPTEGSVIRGNVVMLDLKVSGIEVRRPDGDTSGKTGHFEVFVDARPVQSGRPVPKSEGIVRGVDTLVAVPGLSVGKHNLTVVVADGAGRRLTGAQDELTVMVEGPSVNAKAATGAGQRARVTVGAEGVEIADVPGDASGKTGHLHFFIDREPTPAGVRIPDPEDRTILHSEATSVEFPPLRRGEHFIWIVVGDANHVPFDPPVMDKVVVVVE